MDGCYGRQTGGLELITNSRHKRTKWAQAIWCAYDGFNKRLGIGLWSYVR